MLLTIYPFTIGLTYKENKLYFQVKSLLKSNSLNDILEIHKYISVVLHSATYSCTELYYM